MPENQRSAPASNSEEARDRSAAVTREEILARLDDPALLLVNVMPKETFDDGHIPRSINLPLSEVGTRARQLFADLGREIVIYCGGAT